MERMGLRVQTHGKVSLLLEEPSLDNFLKEMSHVLVTL